MSRNTLFPPTLPHPPLHSSKSRSKLSRSSWYHRASTSAVNFRPGEAPSIALLSARIALYAHIVHREAHLYKSAGKESDKNSIRRKLKKRANMITMRLAVATEEARETLSRIRLESAWRSKCRAESALKSSMRAQADATAEYKRIRLELEERKKQLESLQEANDALTKENQRLAEELKQRRWQPFPPPPVEPPDEPRRPPPPVRASSTSSVDSITPPKRSKARKSLEAIRVASRSAVGALAVPFKLSPIPQSPAVGIDTAPDPFSQSHSFFTPSPPPAIRLTDPSSFVTELEGHPITDMNPRRRSRSSTPPNDIQLREGKSLKGVKRVVSFGSLDPRRYLQETSVPPVPPMPESVRREHGIAGSRAPEVWVQTSPPVEASDVPRPATHGDVLQVTGRVRSKSWTSNPIPLPPRNPRRPSSIVLSDPSSPQSSVPPRSSPSENDPEDGMSTSFHSALSSPSFSASSRSLVIDNLLPTAPNARGVIMHDGTNEGGVLSPYR